MRVILVGSERARDMLRWRLRDSGVAIVGEFPTLVAARASGIEADAYLLTPGGADGAIGSASSATLATSNNALDGSPGDAGPVPGAFTRELRSQAADDGDAAEPLTPREIEVLELLAEGLPNKAIADRLGISDQTVKFHVAQITSKLDVANRTEAVRKAIRRGLLTV